MNRTLILEEIKKEIGFLNEEKLREIFDYIKFLRNREAIDPTLEILQNEDEYLNVKEGIKQKNEGKVIDCNFVK